MISENDSIPAMFDRISRSYDRANRILSCFLDLRWRKITATHLSPKKDLQILDLATGTGDQIHALFKVHPHISSVIGVDLSNGMLQLARKKISQTPYAAKVDFIKGDAEALCLRDASFDACTFSFGIRNVSNPISALKEIHRVTKVGGQCLILEFSLPQNRFRRPFLFYLRHVLPTLGKWVSNDPTAYRYLNESIEKYATPSQFLEWMKEAQWKKTEAVPFLFGAVVLYKGIK